MPLVPQHSPSRRARVKSLRGELAGVYRVAREGDGKSGDARRGGDAPGALPGPGGRAAGSHCPRIGVRVAAATAPAAPAGPQCEWVMSRVRRRPVWAAWAKAAAGRGGGSRGLGAGAQGISPPHLPPSPSRSALRRFHAWGGSAAASPRVFPPLPPAPSRAAPARPPLAVGAGCCARSLPAPHCLNGDVSVSILNSFAGTLEKFFPAGMRGFSLRSSKVYNPCQCSQTCHIQPRSFPLLSAARFPHCRIPDYIDDLARFNKITPQIRSGSLFHV